MDNKQKLIQSLIEKPSTYRIGVVDGSMLPEELKDHKELEFIVRPPSLEVLAKCAEPVLRIPDEVRESKELKLDEAVKYMNEMAEVFAILAHGKSSEYPSWYIPFILKNVTGKELYMLFYESVLKLQTDFFLNSFQIVDQNNPMMMTNPSVLTPTN
ncbi:hypothetical protein [Aestuariibaculum marinum]|uniref:Uncharacterized protein n=1 Tax=Aestuariibaculum marinum TaxID=2683592 RepID=A0A8J6U9X9_9FLAO|nr:hypothetical protein [Aestuariibaculum marinum]MBD0822643.1 hypothetical protein [Aestuariibaculum marinum]